METVLMMCEILGGAGSPEDVPRADAWLKDFRATVCNTDPLTIKSRREKDRHRKKQRQCDRNDRDVSRYRRPVRESSRGYASRAESWLQSQRERERN